MKMQMYNRIKLYIQPYLLFCRMVALNVFVLSYSVCLWKFYTIHAGKYVVLLHLDRFEFSQLLDTLHWLNSVTLRYLWSLPWYVNVLCVVFFISICCIDQIMGALFGIWYISLCLLLGCHYDIVSLISCGAVYYLDLGYIKVEFLYDKSELELQAFRYLLELNTEWGTNFKFDPTLLSEWIELSRGRKTVLMVEISLNLTLRHLLSDFNKLHRKKKDSSRLSWYDWLVKIFSGGKK